MNINKNGLSTLWVIVFLAGCANPPISAPSPASLTPALLATTTLTMTLSPAPTATATPEPKFSQQCLTIDAKEAELSEVASGTTLIEIPPPGRVWILEDVQTGNEYKLPSETKHSWYPFFLQVSPNQKMLALMEWVFNDEHTKISNILWVFNAQAKILSKITFDRTDLGKPRWLDDERLSIDTEEYGNLLLVNPFTGEQLVLANDLPNLDSNFKPGLWWPVIYNPDLEWVAYYSLRKENGNYIEGPAVYNVVKKQILWNAGNGVGSDPVWSPDGQELAFTGGMNEHQLYLFSRLGQVKMVLDGGLPHEAFALSWSPDGHYIAFWNAGSLMIYDRQKDWVFDTCISSRRNTIPPNWSPDSQQVIVYVNDYSTPLILVDWQKKMAFKIKDMPNRVIQGWMNSTP